MFQSVNVRLVLDACSGVCQLRIHRLHGLQTGHMFGYVVEEQLMLSIITPKEHAEVTPAYGCPQLSCS